MQGPGKHSESEHRDQGEASDIYIIQRPRAPVTLNTLTMNTVLGRVFGKLNQNARFIAYLYKLHGPNFSEGLLVELLDLGGSVLGFPLPFFGRLGGLRCLDVIPFGYLLVRSCSSWGRL